MSGTLGIPLAFLIIGAVLLWIVIGSKGWWTVKMGVIALCLLFSVAVWNSVESYQGWPSKNELPPLFLVHWIRIDEPSKTTGKPGAIYIWIRELEEGDSSSFAWLSYGGDRTLPRTYEVPYTKERHKELEKSLNQIKKGVTIIGGKKTCKECGKPGCKGKGKGCPGEGDPSKSGRFGAFSFSLSDDIVLGPLPPPIIPEKLLGPNGQPITADSP